MDNILNINEYLYDIEEDEKFLQKRVFSNQINILNQLEYYFKYKSNTPDVVFPDNFELCVRCHGLMGFVTKEKKFAKCSIVDFDDDNKIKHVVAIGLGTSPKSYGTLTVGEDVILCKNNPLAMTDLFDVNYFSYEKAQNDVSRMFQLVYSRITPLLETDSDAAKDAIMKALKSVKAGKPVVVTTSIFEEIKKLDILDQANIEKMQYLTSYDESLDKNIANRYGASLDIKNKAAQVNSDELKAYDDITTSNYLIAYESRLEFIEAMKEAGYDVEIIVSPIFADEPTKEEIEDPELLDDENESSDQPDENSDEGEENLQNNEEKGDEES